MLDLPRLPHGLTCPTWALAIMLMLAHSQAWAAGAAYPVQGREPIEVLADQIRDRILQRLDEICATESCSNTTAWADGIRQACLDNTVAKHPHGIGGENDLFACMERKSRLSLSDPDPDAPGADDGREPDSADEYGSAADRFGEPRAIVQCQKSDGWFVMRERRDCLDSGGVVIERVQ